MSDKEVQLKDLEVTISNEFKTVVENRFNQETGQKEKITKKFFIKERLECSDDRISGRKAWKKFGDCAKHPDGVVSSTTTHEDVPPLVLSCKPKTSEINESNENALIKKNLVCNLCKGDHFTRSCTNKDLYIGLKSSETSTAEVNSNVYVPPSKKGTSIIDAMEKKKNDGMTVRVSNLPEETTDYDLKLLFSSFGKINRLSLAKDRDTNKFKGYAHVAYSTVEEATCAIRHLHGFGYGHLVLQVTWPR